MEDSIVTVQLCNAVSAVCNSASQAAPPTRNAALLTAVIALTVIGFSLYRRLHLSPLKVEPWSRSRYEVPPKLETIPAISSTMAYCKMIQYIDHVCHPMLSASFGER